MTDGWCSRAVRAAVFAAACVLLAALGHVLMSGTSVPSWALGAGAVAVGGTAWTLAGRERGLPLVVSVTVAAQAALHSGFSLAQAAAQPAGGVTLVRRWVQHMLCAAPMGADATGTGQGSAMAAPMTASGTTPMPSASSMEHMEHMGGGHDMSGMSPTGMLAAHLLAALLCGLWLAHGERAVFRIARAFAGWLVAPLRVPLTLPAPAHRPRIRRHRPRAAGRPRQLLLVHAITSRGPPAGTAVA
ncbi:hypothetical protein M4V62_35710 [Streptomyces durmitorensis]|uniref:PE-PGRS family protein n=1 Tax=Streptomyces durmitorensis TaxID=319947 RepID=A0ABY4Q1C6_9ACTN|nr:hypothetical protein [Streptomyces durmitorensis]UQT59978.1 hypothetical protein M4V62_35710 [Streptomyces durmitorensis]